MNHKAIKSGIFRFDRLDARYHLGRRSAEPGLLINAITQRRGAGRRAGRTPGSALLVGVTHEAEWREPFESFVVRGFEPANGFLAAVSQVNAGAPDHVLAKLLVLATLEIGSVIGADDII